MTSQTSIRPLFWLAAIACAASVGACQPQVDPVVGKASHRIVQPECAAGYCIESDPYPDSVGIFIASSINGDECTDTDNWSDTDVDGLTDRCESALALAFHPSLFVSSTDSIGHEPEYAARPLGYTNGVFYAEILYMPAYYLDMGADGSGGHAGDSEVIGMDVYYNETTQHWILDAVYLSRHMNYGYYCANADKDGFCLPVSAVGRHPTSLSYRDNVQGGAPIIYVSRFKHANYANWSECTSIHIEDDYLENVVEWFTADCESNTYIELAPGGNVGSGTHPLIDCVYSTNPLFSSRRECFWSGTRFGGWQGFTPDTDPYSARLDNFGFAGF